MSSICQYQKFLDMDLFTESKTVSEYLCPLCTGVYFNPVSDPCGHLFCRECLLKYLAHVGPTKMCPILKQAFPFNDEDKIIRPLIFVQEILEKLHVKCKNKCGWSGNLRELVKHMENECPNTKVKCGFSDLGCPMNLLRSDNENHASECEFRPETCTHCQKNVPAKKLEIHYDECPKIIIPCPQGCVESIQREEVEIHLKSCDNTPVDCPLVKIGCEFRSTKKEMEQHNTQEVLQHNKLLMSQLENYERKYDMIYREMLKFSEQIKETSGNPNENFVEYDEVNRKYIKRNGEKMDKSNRENRENHHSHRGEEKVKEHRGRGGPRVKRGGKKSDGMSPNLNDYEYHNGNNGYQSNYINNISSNSVNEDSSNFNILEMNSDSKMNREKESYTSKTPLKSNPIPFINRKRDRESKDRERGDSNNEKDKEKDIRNSSSVKEKNNLTAKTNNILNNRSSPEKIIENLSKTNSKDSSLIINEEDSPIMIDVNYISKGVSVVENRAINSSNSKNEHKFVFANLNLNTSKNAWKVVINNKTSWMAFGCCLKENVISNNYKFIGHMKDHGCFVMSTNGYSWNTSNDEENNSKVGNEVASFPKLETGDVVYFYYNNEKSFLSISVKGFKCVLTNVGSPKGLNLVPCVIFLNYLDEITFTR